MIEGLSFLATLILVALLSYWVGAARPNPRWTSIFDLGDGPKQADKTDENLPPWRRRPTRR